MARTPRCCGNLLDRKPLLAPPSPAPPALPIFVLSLASSLSRLGRPCLAGLASLRAAVVDGASCSCNGSSPMLIEGSPEIGPGYDLLAHGPKTRNFRQHHDAAMIQRGPGYAT